MRLTNFTDYGMRMLMRMAADPERTYSAAELATELKLSRHHLQKIIQRLVDGGVLTTQRGNAGGARFAHAPSKFKVGEVVRLLERDQPLVECLAESPCSCSIEDGCRLKVRLRRAERAFIEDLNKTTLQDIALNNGSAV
jgi:Rrf2 family nitric oxide-sensitive transcriptional repressor